MGALARSAASAYDRHAHGDHGYAQAAGAGIRGGAHGGTMPELQASHLHGGARTRTATQSAPQGILSRQQWRLSTRQSPGSARARHLGYTTGHTGHLGNPPRPRGYVGFFSSFLSLAMVNRPSRAGSHQRATLDARRPSHLPRGPRRASKRRPPMRGSAASMPRWTALPSSDWGSTTTRGCVVSHDGADRMASPNASAASLMPFFTCFSNSRAGFSTTGGGRLLTR